MIFFKRGLYHVFFISSALVSIVIVFSFLSPFFQIADTVSHFRWHLSILLAILAAAGMVVLRWRIALTALMIALTGFSSTMAHVYFTDTSTNTNTNTNNINRLVLVQLNLSFRNRHLDEVIRLIKDRDADFVTLQEVTGKTGRVISMLAKDYPYHIQCAFSSVGGVAVLSRFPLQSLKSSGCVKGHGLAWIRVKVNNTPISLGSIHLHWPYPYGQYRQIMQLETQLKDIPPPLILAGDFNAAPWSHAVSRITTVSRTHVDNKLLFSFSYPIISKLPPLGLPIDHVLLSENLILENIELGPKAGSDHFSVIAKIAMRENN